MLPGFSAERSVYQSRAQYVSVSGANSRVGDVVPAVSSYCMSQGGKVQCGTISGIGEGIFWGLVVGQFGGPVGGVIGAVLGGLYCWIFGCD